MKEKIEIVSLKVINVEDTNIDVDYFNKKWKSWMKVGTEGLLLGINAYGWTGSSICLTELAEIIVNSEWRVANCYNEDPDTRSLTRDKNELDREKKLLAALKEVYELGADVKVKF